MFREFLGEHRIEELLSAPGSFTPFPHCSDRNAWERIADQKKRVLVQWGENALAGYPQLTATQFMAYTRTGERRIFEKPYFDRRKLLFGAAMAECVENQGRFFGCDHRWYLADL